MDSGRGTARLNLVAGQSRPTRGQDAREGTDLKLFFREPREGQLRLGHRPAVSGTKEVVQQPLAGGGVVEDVAYQGGLSGLIHEVSKP